jgi:hypothetical protein
MTLIIRSVVRKVDMKYHTRLNALISVVVGKEEEGKKSYSIIK